MTKVYCKACGERHPTDEVEFLDVEEDISGADVMTFACPRHPEVGRLQSRVYG